MYRGDRGHYEYGLLCSGRDGKRSRRDVLRSVESLPTPDTDLDGTGFDLSLEGVISTWANVVVTAGATRRCSKRSGQLGCAA